MWDHSSDAGGSASSSERSDETFTTISANGESALSPSNIFASEWEQLGETLDEGGSSGSWDVNSDDESTSDPLSPSSSEWVGDEPFATFNTNAENPFSSSDSPYSSSEPGSPSSTSSSTMDWPQGDGWASLAVGKEELFGNVYAHDNPYLNTAHQSAFGGISSWAGAEADDRETLSSVYDMSEAVSVSDGSRDTSDDGLGRLFGDDSSSDTSVTDIADIEDKKPTIAHMYAAGESNASKAVGKVEAVVPMTTASAPGANPRPRTVPSGASNKVVKEELICDHDKLVRDLQSSVHRRKFHLAWEDVELLLTNSSKTIEQLGPRPIRLTNTGGVFSEPRKKTRRGLPKDSDKYTNSGGKAGATQWPSAADARLQRKYFKARVDDGLDYISVHQYSFAPNVIDPNSDADIVIWHIPPWGKAFSVRPVAYPNNKSSRKRKSEEEAAADASMPPSPKRKQFSASLMAGGLALTIALICTALLKDRSHWHRPDIAPRGCKRCGDRHGFEIQPCRQTELPFGDTICAVWEQTDLDTVNRSLDDLPGPLTTVMPMTRTSDTDHIRAFALGQRASKTTIPPWLVAGKFTSTNEIALGKGSRDGCDTEHRQNGTAWVWQGKKQWEQQQNLAGNQSWPSALRVAPASLSMPGGLSFVFSGQSSPCAVQREESEQNCTNCHYVQPADLWLLDAQMSWRQVLWASESQGQHSLQNSGTMLFTSGMTKQAPYLFRQYLAARRSGAFAFPAPWTGMLNFSQIMRLAETSVRGDWTAIPNDIFISPATSIWESMSLAPFGGWPLGRSKAQTWPILLGGASASRYESVSSSRQPVTRAAALFGGALDVYNVWGDHVAENAKLLSNFSQGRHSKYMSGAMLLGDMWFLLIEGESDLTIRWQMDDETAARSAGPRSKLAKSLAQMMADRNRKDPDVISLKRTPGPRFNAATWSLPPSADSVDGGGSASVLYMFGGIGIQAAGVFDAQGTAPNRQPRWARSTFNWALAAPSIELVQHETSKSSELLWDLPPDSIADLLPRTLCDLWRYDQVTADERAQPEILWPSDLSIFSTETYDHFVNLLLQYAKSVEFGLSSRGYPSSYLDYIDKRGLAARLVEELQSYVDAMPPVTMITGRWTLVGSCTSGGWATGDELDVSIEHQSASNSRNNAYKNGMQFDREFPFVSDGGWAQSQQLLRLLPVTWFTASIGSDSGSPDGALWMFGGVACAISAENKLHPGTFDDFTVHSCEGACTDDLWRFDINSSAWHNMSFAQATILTGKSNSWPPARCSDTSVVFESRDGGHNRLIHGGTSGDDSILQHDSRAYARDWNAQSVPVLLQDTWKLIFW